MVSQESLLHTLPPRLHWPIVGREAEVALLVQRMAGGSGAVVVMGAPGLGKSTVVACVLAALDAASQTVIRLPAPQEKDNSRGFIEQWLGVPVPSAASVEAMADQIGALLAEPPSASSTAMLAAGVPILGIDDLHLLDDFGAAVLGRLLQTGRIRLVGTSRADPGLPAAMDALWRSGVVDRTDLVPLSYESIRLILREALPGPASNDLAYRLWTATAGNPLHVRELLYCIVEAGDVSFREHAWMWTAPLPTNRRLTDLLASDISALEGPARDVVDLVALAESVPVAVLAPSATDEVLHYLVQRGLIVISSGPGAATVSIGHPLYAQTLRSLLYPRRKSELFEFLPEPGMDQPEFSRWVEWSLECGVMPGVQKLLAAGAAAEARSQPDRAAALACLAVEHKDLLPQGLVTALLLRARANRDGGWTTKAEADLESLANLMDAGQAPGDEVRVHATRIRADLHQLHHRDVESALDVLGAAATTLDPASQGAAELAVERLARLSHSGRHAELLAAWGARADAPHIPANMTLAPSYVFALGQAGKPLQALAFADAQLPLVGPEHAAFPTVRTAIMSARFWAALWSGRPGLALEMPDYPDDGLQRHDAAIYQTGAGYLCLAHGQWEPAVAELRGGLSRMGIGAPTGLEAMAWAGLAHAHAARGERRFALHASEQYRQLASGMNRSVETDSRYRILLAGLALGQAGLSGLIQAYIEWAGSAGLALGVLLGRHLLLVDATHGQRAALLPALELAAGEVEGLLPGAMLDHAEALLDGDPGVVVAAVARLNEVGIWLPAPLKTVDLTARQREIAALVAAGMSNKSIAQKIGISVRTVDTHIGHIFQRLGVAKRSELAVALSGVQR